ncbi:MAG: hypothetical protein ACLF0P_13985 [Thermoanaerobaculia bacterium]
MYQHKLWRIATILVAGVLLAAAPALAGPNPDTAPDRSTGAGQVAGPVQGHLLGLLADWWAHLTAPVTNLYGANGLGVDPNGEPTADSATGDPTTDPENGLGVDPNG